MLLRSEHLVEDATRGPLFGDAVARQYLVGLEGHTVQPWENLLIRSPSI